MYRLNNFTTRVLRLQGGEGENLRRGAANGAGMRPPLFFGLRPKKSRRRSGGKERRLGAKRHGVPYLLMIRGSQQETLGGRIGVSVGRGPSSSQSPYPSLSAYAESSLIPTLVLSPRKPLRWVFAGAPVLLKFSAVRPRRTAIVRRRVQDRFDLRFPAAGRSADLESVFRNLPGSAERSGERGKRRTSIRRPPTKAAPTPPTAGKYPLCSQRPRRTR